MLEFVETWAPAFCFMLNQGNDILESIQHYKDIGAFENDFSTDEYVMQKNRENFRASQEKKPEVSKFDGEVTLTVQINNRGEYLKWVKLCDPGRQWETIMKYPVLMRKVCEFNTIQQYQELMKEMIGLLQAGFQVYSAYWKLKEEQSNDVAVEEKEEE